MNVFNRVTTRGQMLLQIVCFAQEFVTIGATEGLKHCCVVAHVAYWTMYLNSLTVLSSFCPLRRAS